MTKTQIRKAVDVYYQNPDAFTSSQVKQLQVLAQNYGLHFEPVQTSSSLMDNVGDFLMQATNSASADMLTSTDYKTVGGNLGAAAGATPWAAGGAILGSALAGAMLHNPELAKIIQESSKFSKIAEIADTAYKPAMEAIGNSKMGASILTGALAGGGATLANNATQDENIGLIPGLLGGAAAGYGLGKFAPEMLSKATEVSSGLASKAGVKINKGYDRLKEAFAKYKKANKVASEAKSSSAGRAAAESTKKAATDLADEVEIWMKKGGLKSDQAEELIKKFRANPTKENAKALQEIFDNMKEVSTQQDIIDEVMG